MLPKGLGNIGLGKPLSLSELSEKSASARGGWSFIKSNTVAVCGWYVRDIVLISRHHTPFRS